MKLMNFDLEQRCIAFVKCTCFLHLSHIIGAPAKIENSQQNSSIINMYVVKWYMIITAYIKMWY